MTAGARGIDFVQVGAAQPRGDRALLLWFFEPRECEGLKAEVWAGGRRLASGLAVEALGNDLPAGFSDKEQEVVERCRTKIGVVTATSLDPRADYLVRVTREGDHSAPSTCPFGIWPDSDSETGWDITEEYGGSGGVVPQRATTTAGDYLARDYQALRTVLVDRAATLMPGWSDTNPADPVVMLLEVFAHLGDLLSYRQDAVAQEAYLVTATTRRSVRRHARLLDYRVSEGCAARTFVAFTAHGDAEAVGLAAGEKVTARAPGTVERLDTAAERVVFETLENLSVDPDRNCFTLSHSDMPGYVLPQGAVSAHLDGGSLVIKGSVLVLATRSEEGGEVVPAQAVLVTAVGDSEGDGSVEVRWAPEDALRAPLAVPSIGHRAVAFGNVALAHHAAEVAAEGHRLGAVPERGAYRPVLRNVRIAHVHPNVDRSSAAAMLRTPAHEAVPRIAVTFSNDGSENSAEWKPVPDLLGSGADDPHFVVETEEDGTVVLRFGDGRHGRMPPPGATATANCWAGGGSAGNIGHMMLTEVACDGVSVACSLAATGGEDPEPLDLVRERATHRLRRQASAVSTSDYADLARAVDGVRAAIARRRWVGTRSVVDIVIDPDRQGPPVEGTVVADRVATALDKRRLVGHEVAVTVARYVPITLEVRVQVVGGQAREGVLRTLRSVFSSGLRPDGSQGYFHQDRFSFGVPLQRDDLEAEVLALSGVVDARVPEVGGAVADDEILRCDSDPANPAHGRITFVVEVER